MRYDPHTDEKTIKLHVDGFAPAELDAIAAGKDVRIGATGVTTVNAVSVQRIANPTNDMADLSAEALAKADVRLTEGLTGVLRETR